MDAIKQAAAEHTALLDLLAIIHRDGGHYTFNHGILKSVKDATAAVTALRTDLDNAQEELRESDREWSRHSCYPRDGND